MFMFHILPELNGMVDLAKVKVSYAIEKLYLISWDAFYNIAFSLWEK